LGERSRVGRFWRSASSPRYSFGRPCDLPGLSCELVSVCVVLPAGSPARCRRTGGETMPAARFSVSNPDSATVSTDGATLSVRPTPSNPSTNTSAAPTTSTTAPISARRPAAVDIVTVAATASAEGRAAGAEVEVGVEVAPLRVSPRRAAARERARRPPGAGAPRAPTRGAPATASALRQAPAPRALTARASGGDDPLRARGARAGRRQRGRPAAARPRARTRQCGVRARCQTLPPQRSLVAPGTAQRSALGRDRRAGVRSNG